MEPYRGYYAGRDALAARHGLAFEKDLVSQAEVRRRIEQWAAVLKP